MSERMAFGEPYDRAGEGKCWLFWHPALGAQGPYCQQDAGHDGDHDGGGMHWSRSPEVDVETAAKFLHFYRRVPNHNHDIVLNDDCTVSMTLAAFGASVAFIGVGPGDD